MKSLSELTPQKEYIASSTKFKKKKKKKSSVDQSSASSDKGYHSSDDFRDNQLGDDLKNIFSVVKNNIYS